jgi:ABC-type sugar transport system permease subunit
MNTPSIERLDHFVDTRKKYLGQLLRRFPSLGAWLLLFPAVTWLVVFFVAPLFIVLVYAFLERGTYGGVVWQFTTENFARVCWPMDGTVTSWLRRKKMNTLPTQCPRKVASSG